MNRFAVTTVVVLAALSGSIAGAQSSRTGCYRADRPLGASASTGEMPVLKTFRLLEEGRVDRPGTQERDWWKAGSRWSVKRDTLVVVLSTRLSGWRLTLAKRDSMLIGEARYLSDVVVPGHVPQRVPVRVTRERC